MRKIHDQNLYTNLLNELSIDCKNCCGLCCVGLYFSKLDGFPCNKKAGIPCSKLNNDFFCSIHSKLAIKKCTGCISYDCLGAGQKTIQNIYHGANWKDSPQIAEQMFLVFAIIYQLSQILWYLVEASSIIFAVNLREEIHKLILENQQLTQLSPENILTLNINDYRSRVNYVLKKTSQLVSNAIEGKSTFKASKDYALKNFKKQNLDGMDFSMSLMIAANLEGCNLYGTNFLGADLRDANMKNTDLSNCIFLTRGQINAAKINSTTILPDMHTQRL